MQTSQQPLREFDIQPYESINAGQNQTSNTDEPSVGLGEAFGRFKGMFGQAISYVKDHTSISTKSAISTEAVVDEDGY